MTWDGGTIFEGGMLLMIGFSETLLLSPYRAAVAVAVDNSGSDS